MNPNDSFHLYLLMGQSNMAGRGEVEPEDRQAHLRVFALDKAGAWVSAVDPIHFDKPSIAGVGPGVTFGKVMAEHMPSVRIGLIPCAAGGSPVTVWKPGGYWEQTKSTPYDDALERTKVAMEHGVLKGMLWHQGESDSNPKDAALYEGRLIALIDRLRVDLNAPELPFISGTLGDFFVKSHAEGKQVNAALRNIPQQVRQTACVDSAGLDHLGDHLHFSSSAARELGRRYARAMIPLLA